MTTQLHEKDEQCRHIASVLHAKNAEWKQIKRKLSSAKKQNESFEGGAEGDIEVIIMNSEKNNCEQSDKMDSENIICVQNMNDCVQSGTVKYVDSDTVKNGDNTVSNTDNSIADDGLTQSPPTYDDCTQLPVQSTETQSHLDALIDLITDAEDTDLDTVVASNKENHRRSLSAMDTAKIQKRKSHSRGCACCDKVVRKNFRNLAHIFLVLLGYTDSFVTLRSIPSS